MNVVGLCFAFAALRAVSGAVTTGPRRFLQQEYDSLSPVVIGGGSNETTAAIIGGNPVTAGVYPWHAVPNTTQTRLLCGAFLIHPDVIASAAHCKGYWAGFDIIIGSTLLNGEDAIDVIRGVQEYIHPENLRQDNPNFREDNDILLVKLQSPSSAPVAKLNTRSNFPDDGDRLTAIGFGYFLPGQDRVSDTLLEAEINPVDSSACVGILKSPPFFADNMLCAGNSERGICRGDSGSPVLDRDSGEVVGISSFATSYTCATPAVFTRISAYDSWIQETLCSISDEPPESCSSTDICEEKQPCKVLNFFPGYMVHLDLNLLGLYPYCFEICAISYFAAFFDTLFVCGEC